MKISIKAVQVQKRDLQKVIRHRFVNRPDISTNSFPSAVIVGDNCGGLGRRERLSPVHLGHVNGSTSQTILMRSRHIRCGIRFGLGKYLFCGLF
jgi:hypothetical protein